MRPYLPGQNGAVDPRFFSNAIGGGIGQIKHHVAAAFSFETSVEFAGPLEVPEFITLPNVPMVIDDLILVASENIVTDYFASGTPAIEVEIQRESGNWLTLISVLLPNGLTSGNTWNRATRESIWGTNHLDYFQGTTHSVVPHKIHDGLVPVSFDNTSETVQINDFAGWKHGLTNGGQGMFVSPSGSTMPTGLSSLSPYYMIDRTDYVWKVSLTSGGAAVTFSTDGSGPIYWKPFTGNAMRVGKGGIVNPGGKAIRASWRAISPTATMSAAFTLSIQGRTLGATAIP